MASDAKGTAVVPMMGAEGGFETIESVAPIRISGFLSLLFGLLSFLAIIASPMIGVPMIAIFLGLIALRPWGDLKPVGVTPARIGMILAVGFGGCGFLIHTMRSHTLGSQAEYFAREYLELLGRGDAAIALELGKDPINRLPLDVSLQDHYMSSEERIERFEEFKQEGMVNEIGELGPGVYWELKKQPQVYMRYQDWYAQMVFTNPESPRPLEVYVQLKYMTDRDGKGQWVLDQCRRDAKRLVAESVL